MQKVDNITGFNRYIFILKLKIHIFLFFLPELFMGKITLRRFLLFLKRLLFFLSRLQHNKFVRIGGKTRIDLYVPGYPSKAFLTACKKFIQFENKMPCTTVLISVTSACMYHCSHCYQKHDKGKDVQIDKLTDVVRKLQDMGIAFFNIEGGEPFLTYERLKRVCASIDERSEIWVNSTGAGITRERLTELKKMNVTAIMFSLHNPDPCFFNEFMGSDSAWDTFESAVHMCHEADMAVALNTCLLKEDFYNNQFEIIMEKAKDLKVSLIQLIKPKPSGGWLGRENLKFAPEDINLIKSKVNQYNSKIEFKNYPAVFAQIIEEDKDVFGCTAGGIDRFYINAKGDVQPCEFLNISFGNISEENFEKIYVKMRDCFEWAGDCSLCEEYSREVERIYKENHLTSLPLPPKLSEKIYTSWNRGSKTELYKILEEMGKKHQR